MSFRVILRGNFKKEFRGMIRRCRDLRPPLRRIGAFMLRSTQQNFAAQGRIDLQRRVWPKLSPLTILRRRAAQRRSIKILQATGRLKNSIVFEVGVTTVAIGTNVSYAPDHQQDGVFGASKLIDRTVRIPTSRRKGGRVKAHIRLKDGQRIRVAAHQREPTIVKAHTVRERFRLPARPFLRFHGQDLRRAGEQLMRHCLKSIGLTPGVDEGEGESEAI